MARRLDYSNMFRGEESPWEAGGENPPNMPGHNGPGPGTGGTPEEECPPGYKKVYTTDGFRCELSGGIEPPIVPNTPQPQECGEGYEWESGGDPVKYPNGRCKVKGTRWEDECFIRDGKVYCKDNPLPANPSTGSNPSPNPTTGGTPSPSIPALPTTPENPYKDYETELWDLYKKLFGNSDVKAPYTPEVIARLEGKVKGISEVTKASNKQALLANRAAMGATGKTGQAIRNINSQADQKVAQEAIDINHTAIRANYDSEVANITRKMQILDSQTQFAMALAGNAIQRQNIQYNYQIQRMQIQNQMEMLKLQLLTQLGAR